jgi:type II secretory pathway component PulF
MAYFKISYLGQDGTRQTAKKSAETKEQAIAATGVPSGAVLDVSLDHFGAFTSSLTEKKFPLLEQALMLSATASKLFAGKTFSRAIIESVPFKKLGLSQMQVDACQTAKDYLELFRFDETTILLVDAGEKSGRLPDALYNAADSIKRREADRKEFGRAMTQGILYSSLGLMFSIGIPLWAGSTMIEFINVQKVSLQLNNFSDIILFLYSLYTEYTLGIIAVVIAAFLFRMHIWEHTRRWPFVKFVNERMKVKRALDFVQAFQLLRKSGYTNPQTFRFLQVRSKGLTYQLYTDSIDRLVEGRDLSSVFNNEEWPELLHQNLAGFDMQGPEGRDLLLSNMAAALREYYLSYSHKISKVCMVVGFALIIFTILMFAIGFYLPLVSFSANIT